MGEVANAVDEDDTFPRILVSVDTKGAETVLACVLTKENGYRVAGILGEQFDGLDPVLRDSTGIYLFPLQ